MATAVEALRTIEQGSAVGLEMFMARLGGRRRPTWFAVNILQDTISASRFTASATLESIAADPQALSTSVRTGVWNALRGCGVGQDLAIAYVEAIAAELGPRLAAFIPVSVSDRAPEVAPSEPIGAAPAP